MRVVSWSRCVPTLTALVLLACGTGACVNATSPTPPSAAQPVHTPVASACGLPRFESTLLQAVNEFRAASRRCGARGRFAAAGRVRWSGALAQLASAHARDMAARNEVTHDDARGSGPAQRATQAGYAWSVFAENVAGNYPGTTEVMAGWQGSAGHCANLMDPAITEVGVACAPGTPTSEFKTYWAMELAKPR